MENVSDIFHNKSFHLKSNYSKFVKLVNFELNFIKLLFCNAKYFNQTKYCKLSGRYVIWFHIKYNFCKFIKFHIQFILTIFL